MLRSGNCTEIRKWKVFFCVGPLNPEIVLPFHEPCRPPWRILTRGSLPQQLSWASTRCLCYLLKRQTNEIFNLQFFIKETHPGWLNYYFVKNLASYSNVKLENLTPQSIRPHRVKKIHQNMTPPVLIPVSQSNRGLILRGVNFV